MLEVQSSGTIGSRVLDLCSLPWDRSPRRWPGLHRVEGRDRRDASPPLYEGSGSLTRSCRGL